MPDYIQGVLYNVDLATRSRKLQRDGKWMRVSTNHVHLTGFIQLKLTMQAKGVRGKERHVSSN
eukprot:1144053-Pelagomonas_calceolata.AAC.2